MTWCGADEAALPYCESVLVAQRFVGSDDHLLHLLRVDAPPGTTTVGAKPRSLCASLTVLVIGCLHFWNLEPLREQAPGSLNK